jgi:cell fate regulator YaaT (PSP1 superfamily)
MADDRKIDIDNSFFTRGCCVVPDTSMEGTPFKPSCAKLDSLNWLKDFNNPSDNKAYDLIEVRFKNSKKDFFKANRGIGLQEGDFVAVEASPGHDIGIVSLTGHLVRKQMKRKKTRVPEDELKKIYRRARISDVEKWISAVDKEHSAIFQTRKAANDLHLNMKVNDVEYQGDGTKAIFYYTADERVDFRQLIKVLAEMFRVRIEMKQIGARQEAARLGGIGSCGRELCCATWMAGFSSVSTNNARTQQLSLNPSKLAGQCGKLKCCLNYENAMYLEALREFPDSEVKLKTKKGVAEYQKADVFKQSIWYSYENDFSSMMAIPLKKVKEIQAMNEKGKMPEKLEDFAETMEQKAEEESGPDLDGNFRFEEDEIY